jgi:hypothetical protein
MAPEHGEDMARRAVAAIQSARQKGRTLTPPEAVKEVEAADARRERVAEIERQVAARRLSHP